MSGLDMHSDFLTADEYREMQAGASGTFSGVGIELGSRDGWPMVVTPLAGGPADAAGVRAGDRIASVDGVPTQGRSPSDMVKLLRGERGTQVKVGLLRAGLSVPVEIGITRDTVRTQSVAGRLEGDKVGDKVTRGVWRDGALLP